MRRFYCVCGHEVFLESSYCTHCGSTLGYDIAAGTLVTLESKGNGLYAVAGGRNIRLCANNHVHGVCNAIVDINDSSEFCIACRLNRTIPNLANPENHIRWRSLEEAKRRLIFGLLSLGLPLEAPVAGYPRGLCFDFLEDRRTNSEADEAFVSTGHHEGVITINVLEADDVQRVWQREQSSERYRTLLGHLRHESGHYYFELLVRDLNEFSSLFGDYTLPYGNALKHYYKYGPLGGWEQGYISAYASAHPLEDWAECFAHYLHMTDTLETASLRGAIAPLSGTEGIDHLLDVWDGFAVTLNELNRSLGLKDAYPFVVTPTVAEKLRYVHERIRVQGEIPQG